MFKNIFAFCFFLLFISCDEKVEEQTGINSISFSEGIDSVSYDEGTGNDTITENIGTQIEPLGGGRNIAIENNNSLIKSPEGNSTSNSMLSDAQTDVIATDETTKSVSVGSDGGSQNTGVFLVGGGGNATGISATDLGSMDTTISDQGSNDLNSIKIKGLKILSIALFFLFLSIFLLKISTQSWSYFQWFRNQEALRNKRKEHDDDIMQMTTLLADIVLNPDSKPIAYKERLNKDIQKSLDAKDSLDIASSVPDFSKEKFVDKNVLILGISLSFFLLYFFASAYILEILEEHFLFIIAYHSDLFSFPLLICASFFSAISLFRFILTQGENNNYSKNRVSLFGIIVSLITVAAAIITISKFLIE